MSAPKTNGPTIVGLSIREAAAVAWTEKKEREHRSAERAASSLAMQMFGVKDLEFDSFVPDEYAARHWFQPKHVVTFAIDGIEFNYRAADEKRPSHFQLIDMCAYGRGPRILASIYEISDLGKAYDWMPYQDVYCESCKEDAKLRVAKLTETAGGPT